MARIRHGEAGLLGQLDEALESVHEISRSLHLASAPLRVYGLTRYDYLFPNLQSDSDALLRPDKQTVQSLIALGETMNDPDTDPALDSSIPSAYTYFGQFVDHDITLELQSEEIANLDAPDLKPLNVGTIREKIKNRRSPTLDLDSVYGVTSDGAPVPRRCDKMAVGFVSYAELAPKIPGKRPPNMDVHNDVPRKAPMPGDYRVDREAVIGDGRNDENLILSQMHLAFLRAHNALVARGLSFNAARRELVLHFQWLIIHDFLTKVADREIIQEILTYGNRYFRPSICDLYMPLEFSVAAFRFGHSMVRSKYDYNLNFRKEQGRPATLRDLFSVPTFTGLPDELEQLPEQWVIEWKNFLVGGSNVARRIDTRLVEPLSTLSDEAGVVFEGVKRSLAVRNLLRGYLLRIPIGQKVAQACGTHPLTPDQILAVAANEAQTSVLTKFQLHKNTPLWFYILAEAAGRNSLGPVGSTIVGEVLIGLIRWSDDSILREPGWEPTLGSSKGSFTLKDFFQLAGVWT